MYWAVERGDGYERDIGVYKEAVFRLAYLVEFRREEKGENRTARYC